MQMQRLARHLSSSSASLAISNRGRSCIQCQRYSVAASSAVLDTSPKRRSRGKVSMSERRSLVESFVNKYRVMNAGKFPTTKHVISAVGGGFYAVRKIVQELQHESQTPLAVMVHNNQQYEKVKKESQPFSSVREEISAVTLLETSLGNEEDSKSKSLSYADQSPNSEDIGSKIADDVFTRVLERDIEKEDQTPEIVNVDMASGLQEVSKEISSSKNNEPADTTKEVYMSEEGHGIIPTSKISLNETEELEDSKYVSGLGVEPKDYLEETTQVEESTSDRNLEKYAEIEEKSFAWKHMKSLAEGIMKIWRRF